MCQMFRNANAFTEIGTTAEGLQEDIIIQGVGRALLDGGKHNGLREVNSGRDGLPGVVHNLTIYLHNVRNFKIDGLTFRDQRWWAVAFAWAWDGVVSNLQFKISHMSYRSNHPNSAQYPWCNQDGVDLRVGCHDIQIMNLMGDAEDDIVALTALAPQNSGSFENRHRCKHLSSDIYNVSIRNITAYTNHCAIIRLLCHYRNRLYNINIDNIIDSTPDSESFIINEGKRNATCIKVGEFGYVRNHEDLCRLGEMRNISISNVQSSAFAAVALNVAVKNISIRNVFVGEKGRHAVAVSRIAAGRHYSLEDPQNLTVAQNILVDGIYSVSQREGGSPFFFTGMTAKNFVAKNISFPKEQTLFEEMNPQTDSETVTFENVTQA